MPKKLIEPKTLIDIVVDSAVEWANKSGLDDSRTVHLAKHLRETLEEKGFFSYRNIEYSGEAKEAAKYAKKQILLDIIRTKEAESIRKMMRILGYKSPRSVGVLLDELKNEGKIEFSQKRGWKVINESQD